MRRARPANHAPASQRKQSNRRRSTPLLVLAGNSATPTQRRDNVFSGPVPVAVRFERKKFAPSLEKG